MAASATQSSPAAAALPPIPRVVHQLWMQGEADAPEKVRASFAAWRSAVSAGTGAPWAGWRHTLWDERRVVRLLRRSYPQWLKPYLRVLNTVVRADIARAFVLHARGGLYVDADCVPTRLNFDWPAPRHREAERAVPVLISQGAKASPVIGAVPTNCVIASSRGALFWTRDFLPRVSKSLERPGWFVTLASIVEPDAALVDIAGPLAYRALRDSPLLRIAPYGLLILEGDDIRRPRAMSETLTFHGTHGSWRPPTVFQWRHRAAVTALILMAIAGLVSAVRAALFFGGPRPAWTSAF